jgi:hypothetical protein
LQGSTGIEIQLMAARPSWSDNEFVGHAFLCVIVHMNSGTKEDCFGFYPLEGGAGFIGGPGEVAAEFQKNPARFSRITVSMRRPITEEQRRRVYAMINEWNSKSYHLTHQSCNDFVNAVAQMLGWKVPPRVGTDFPETFLGKLRDANSPASSSVGRWTGYVKTDEVLSFDLTIVRTASGLSCTSKRDGATFACTAMVIGEDRTIVFKLTSGSVTSTFSGTVAPDYMTIGGTFAEPGGTGSWLLRK